MHDPMLKTLLLVTVIDFYRFRTYLSVCKRCLIVQHVRLSYKNITLPKWSLVLNCCSGRPVIFSDSWMTDDEGINLPFIYFNHYEYVRYSLLHKKILLDHVNHVLHALNYDNQIKTRFTKSNSTLLKSFSTSYFHSEYYTPAI